MFVQTYYCVEEAGHNRSKQTSRPATSPQHLELCPMSISSSINRYNEWILPCSSIQCIRLRVGRFSDSGSDPSAVRTVVTETGSYTDCGLLTAAHAACGPLVML